MKFTNFEITESIAIISEGEYLDLHSNYDFMGFSYQAKNRALMLEWSKSTGIWADGERYNRLQLLFKSVL